MRNKKLFSALGLSVILAQLVAGCGEKTEVKPIEFEQPEQPVVSAPIETENNGEYIVIDESIVENEMDDDTLEELGCFVATTDELAEAEKKASTTLASQYAGDGSASSPAIKTPPASAPTPLNPNDELIEAWNGSWCTYRSSETGQKYSLLRKNGGGYYTDWLPETPTIKGW